jgi:hypothetical protein
MTSATPKPCAAEPSPRHTPETDAVAFQLNDGVMRYNTVTGAADETKAQAVSALDIWDGQGDPPGPWIKEKTSNRLGPGATL